MPEIPSPHADRTAPFVRLRAGPLSKLRSSGIPAIALVGVVVSLFAFASTHLAILKMAHEVIQTESKQRAETSAAFLADFSDDHGDRRAFTQ